MSGMGDERRFQTLKLSRDYGISEAHVQEMLIGLASDGRISVCAYDGRQVRLWHRWENTNNMFFNTTDGGDIRVKILAAGAELVEDLPKSKIGFATA
jgi:hypothetical protein